MPHKSQKKGRQCALDKASGLCKGRKGPFTQLWIDSSYTCKHNTSLNPCGPCANPDGPLKDGSHQARSLSQWTCGCQPKCVSGWGRDLCVWHLFLYVLWTERPCVCMPVCWPWARLKQQTLLLLNDPENQCVRTCMCVYEKERERVVREISEQLSCS